MSNDKVAAFAGTLAEFYDRYLVPLIFAPYAEVVADRVKARLPRRVLKTAAGTGVVTEAMARILPTDVTITATDLNEPMIDAARSGAGGARACRFAKVPYLELRAVTDLANEQSVRNYADSIGQAMISLGQASGLVLAALGPAGDAWAWQVDVTSLPPCSIQRW